MADINHHGTVEKRIDDYIENLKKIQDGASEEKIIQAISNNSLDVYLENQMGISVCTKPTALSFRDDTDAIGGVVSWLGVIGFIITVAQVIRKNLEDYSYIPFWRRGSDDKPYSYKFQTKQSSEDPKIDVFMNFFKRVYKKEREFGFMFGDVDKKKNKITVEAIIPAEELAEVIETLEIKNRRDEILKVTNENYNERDKKAVTALHNLIGNVRTGNVAGKANIIKEVIDLLLAKRKHIILTRQKLNLLEKKLRPEDKTNYAAEICKTGVWEKLKAKPLIGRTTYLRGKFLGAYYYENGLLKQAIMPEKVLEKLDVKKIKKSCNIKNLPQLLFFTKENFEKIDSIMNGCLPFFEDEGRKDLPILVCLDRNSVIARSMCIAYKTEEGIYKRIRNYSPKKKKA